MPRALLKIPVPLLPREAADAVRLAPAGDAKVDVMNHLFRIAILQDHALLRQEAVDPNMLPIVHFHDLIAAAMSRNARDINICSPAELDGEE